MHKPSKRKVAIKVRGGGGRGRRASGALPGRRRRDATASTADPPQVLEKSRIGGADDFVRVKREMEVMRTLDHPNVAILEDVLEDAKHYFFVLEFVEGGELFDYIVSHQYIREKDARRPFRQICVCYSAREP